MKFQVNKVYPDCRFEVTGTSYPGMPQDNTAMYISKKAAYLINYLKGHKNCLIFAENGVDPDEDVLLQNEVIFSDNPQLEYARFADILADEIQKEEGGNHYTLTPGGYYVGQNAVIGDNAYIEPGVLIGHNVVIGKNARILSGSVVKNAIIGGGFLCNENAAIGNNGFTMAKDESGNGYRIPSLGRVIIGSHVEVGACCDIARGACGDTILEDYVKMDGQVHISHEVHLHKNVELAAGAAVGGFAEIGEGAYIGINASIRNRIRLGGGCVVGMGATVTKDVDEDVTVVGNPARPFRAGMGRH